MNIYAIQCLVLVISVGYLQADVIYPDVGKTASLDHPEYCNLYMDISTHRCPEGQLFDVKSGACASKDKATCNAEQKSDCYPYGVDGCTTYPGENDRKCCPLVQNGVEKRTKCVSLTKAGGGYRTTCYPA